MARGHHIIKIEKMLHFPLQPKSLSSYPDYRCLTQGQGIDALNLQ